MFAKYIMQLEKDNGEIERIEFILTPNKLTLFEILLAEGWEVVETLEESS